DRLPRPPDPAQRLHRGAHPARRRGAPERHRTLRSRSEDVVPRRPLQGARGGQPLPRRWQLLPVELCGEPGAHDHGERPPRGRSSAGASRVRRLALLLATGLLAGSGWAGQARIRAVDAIGMTVSDMDRSVDFYSRVLGFLPVSDVELMGEAYEQLRDVFPIRMRV